MELKWPLLRFLNMSWAQEKGGDYIHEKRFVGGDFAIFPGSPVNVLENEAMATWFAQQTNGSRLRMENK